MKKIILILVLFLNISIGFDNGSITIKPFQEIYAQEGCPINANTSGTGGGFWSWLSDIRQDVSGAITNILGSVRDFFNNLDFHDGEGMGGEDYGGTPPTNDYGFDPAADTFDNYPEGEGPNPWDDPNFNDYNWGTDERNVVGSIYDYNKYYWDYISGFPPRGDTARIDTVSTTKVDCDSSALARGSKLTRVYDSVKNKANMVKLKDSAINGKNESGLTIIKNSSAYDVWNFQTGDSQAVTVETSSPNNTCVAGVHSHPFGKSNTPSPGDLYHLIEGWEDNHSYFADYVVASDITEFAIMIADTAKVKDFLATHSRDSTIVLNDWDSIRVTPGTGNTYYKDYFDYMVSLYNEKNYPIEFVQAYANVIMYNYRFRSGVKMYKKVNGQFKELNFNVSFDANNNPVFKITICL